MKRIYSSSLLVQLRPARQSDFEEVIKEFSAKLSLVPLPPPGQLHVVRKYSFFSFKTRFLSYVFNVAGVSVSQSFNLRPLHLVLPSREDQDRPVIDLDLHLPFLCFSHTTLLQVTGLTWSHKSRAFAWSDGRPLLRCCPTSFKSRGWCSSPPTGPDSLWLLRVCCSTCRSVPHTESSCISSSVVRLSRPIVWRLFSAPVVAASIRPRLGQRDAGLPHGSYGLPDGLPHQPLWRGCCGKFTYSPSWALADHLLSSSR